MHYLVRPGATLVTSAEEVLEGLELRHVAQQQEARQAVPTDPTEAVLLAYLSGEPVHIDELAREAGLPVSVVAGTLTMMELKGLARSAGGMSYVLA